MTTLAQRLKYYGTYTAGSYADSILSIPIWAGEKLAQASEKVFSKTPKDTPAFLTLEHTREHSSTYRLRQRLRDRLDTSPGALFLQSNIVAAVPFIAVGMPAAELAQKGIERYMADAPEMVQHGTNSLATLAAQMLVAYTAFMANEVRTNFQEKYSTEGKLNWGKVWKGLGRSVKAFLTFDLSYVGLKTAGQSYLLYKGQDPWKASAFFDSIVMPAWYTVAIPLGLRNRVIETERTREWDGLEQTLEEPSEHRKVGVE